MEEKLRLAIGIAGNVSSVLLYSSPIVTFIRVIRKRNTKEFSCVPYVVSLLAALIYFWYGLPIVSYKWENITPVTICGVGVILESSYVLIYIWFGSATRKRMGILMVVFVIMVVSTTILVSTIALHDRHHRKLFVGSMGVVVGIGMYASPLAVVKQVVQTKSVEFMPFYLSLSSLLNSSFWGLYAILSHDPFIGIPGAFGCPSSVLQLVLHYIYRKREILEEPSDTDLEKDGRKIDFQQPVANKD